MAADKEASGPAGQYPPLRNPLYVSGVMSCHWPDLLTQYQREYFACVKTDCVHYLPHACMCVHKNSDIQ